ncbi:acetyl-CoA C-acetyltransferase [Vibrio panuliri]|uniref:Acetyl-CoA acetyltransferase n=1 Tax=Vibrio panuliri TaxID=1381081 RepID=A0A1Q9HQJ4_9VIBR|nr:acetyl-CoA C-acetyltransferase [Vibrio panuliri]KAB1457995.1 acetyl-CoA C-acetyltransferase [Vibrio panuliri]OLQ89623.1 acetyl-CoA acetyltransferase [Vibrio panuliri]OLQ93115.1 acetyl-CoA acetyltransferase [Vibrio panuliri]
MRKVYIVAAKRTALGSFGGSLASTPAAELGGHAIAAALAQANIAPNLLDEVIVGNVLSAGQGMGPGRQAAKLAGVPDSVPAFTLNMICGSGMKTVMEAASKIKAGDADLIVAAGMENMSCAPYVLDAKNRFGSKMGHQQLVDTMINDGLTDAFNQYHMGMTAENVAEKYQIDRQTQDAFALRSQQRAVAAINQGKFTDEIAPIEVLQRREKVSFAQDEYPRHDASLESLAKLKPAFRKEGSVTAGNASGINDGGVAFILASADAVATHQLKPLAEIVSYGQGGLDPAYMGLGPVPAIEQALDRAQMTLADMQLLELNEAFAAQALGVMHGLSDKYQLPMTWFDDKTNVNGGAIALGHPLGASGGRILTTLIYEMDKRQLEYGLASLCIGGGMGTAIVIRKLPA